MAHWFHRNPLKATTQVNFDLKGVVTRTDAQKVCSELRESRRRLLEIVSNPNNDKDILKQSVEKYISLLHGFITSLDPAKPGDSKIRHAVKFRWTNTLLGNVPTEQADFLYDEICMLFNVGLWYTKHASKLAGKDEPDMDEAKEVHKCLRLAAGVFTTLKNELVPRLIEVPEKGTDFDTRVLDAYINQCTAEAQEVTIARAIEMKHASSLISALAYETAQMYSTADDALVSQDDKVAGKWRKYLQFKKAIYYAYAYNFHGETLLAQDKCGEAIKCLEESTAEYEKSERLSKEYASTKGAGTTAKPHEHLFFRKLGPVLKRTLEKCVRENGFIYHQKVPPTAPELELKATYGLVAPEEFTPPSPSPLWTPEVYAAFDVSKTEEKDPKESKKEEEEKGKEIPPVKEADIPQSNKDPNTFSGCVVS